MRSMLLQRLSLLQPCPRGTCPVPRWVSYGVRALSLTQKDRPLEVPFKSRELPKRPITRTERGRPVCSQHSAPVAPSGAPNPKQHEAPEAVSEWRVPVFVPVPVSCCHLRAATPQFPQRAPSLRLGIGTEEQGTPSRIRELWAIHGCTSTFCCGEGGFQVRRKQQDDCVRENQTIPPKLPPRPLNSAAKHWPQQGATGHRRMGSVLCQRDETHVTDEGIRPWQGNQP
ncbi:hypothetical protein WMY93_006530 [Mugilogobius chulae]|uniref:Uncharacterized protein n=1 Tax=Mugilogobius chulae TaxID=88201 RepID=A0AAW0PK54_9GOBI